MKKVILFSFLTLLLATLIGCQKDEPLDDVNDDQPKTVNGMYMGAPIPPEGCSVKNGIGLVHFLFDGNVTHVGESTWEACQYNSGTDEFTPEGFPVVEILKFYFTITTADGDQFTGYYT